jgi:hypothetical protein
MPAPRVPFEASVGGKNLPVLAHAVHSMACVAKDVQIAVVDGVLRFCALNDSRQAFAQFDFAADFFEEFRSAPVVPPLRMSVKCCQTPFRSTRNVERMRISLHAGARRGDEHHMVFAVQCRHGMSKTYRFFFEATEIMQAVYDQSSASNALVARTAMLKESIDHIAGTDEIVLSVDAQKRRMHLASFHPDLGPAGPEQFKVLQTDLSIMTSELVRSSLSASAEMTLCLRELRAFVHFCDAKAVDVENLGLCFDDGGRPLLVTTSPVVEQHAEDGRSRSRLFSAQLILSTAPPRDASVFGASQGAEGGEASSRAGEARPGSPPDDGAAARGPDFGLCDFAPGGRGRQERAGHEGERAPWTTRSKRRDEARSRPSARRGAGACASIHDGRDASLRDASDRGAPAERAARAPPSHRSSASAPRPGGSDDEAEFVGDSQSSDDGSGLSVPRPGRRDDVGASSPGRGRRLSEAGGDLPSRVDYLFDSQAPAGASAPRAGASAGTGGLGADALRAADDEDASARGAGRRRRKHRMLAAAGRTRGRKRRARAVIDSDSDGGDSNEF